MGTVVQHSKRKNYVNLVEQGPSEDGSGLGEIIMDIDSHLDLKNCK